MSLDPVTLAVLAGRMEQIADEMDATLFRAAFNPTIAEARDASHGLYHARTGATLVQGKNGLPIFVGVMAQAARTVIAKADRDGDLRDGDVYAFNDAHAGGTHLNDMRLVRPVFHDGRLFLWLAGVGHWADLGGAAPGNYNPAATDVWAEAFVLPPVKLVAAGAMNRDLVDVILRNSRLPDVAMGDLSAQLGALDLGARRIAELIADWGAETVAAALDALTARAERLMRAEIAILPDGAWEAEDALDNDGVTDAALPVRVRLAVAGERLTLDFTGSAPATRGPVNISRATAEAACYVALKHLFPELPANAGVMAPVDIVIPPGCLLAAEHPRPTGGYTETIMRMIDVVFCAFAGAAPDRAIANAYGTINALSLSGQRPEGGRWVMFSFFGGGHGGTPDGDGLNHGNAPISTATIPPVEIMEAAYPVRFTQWALRPGSGGAGACRGGLGAVYEIELLAEEAELFLFGERARFGPKGVLGGADGAPGRFAWQDESGDWRSPPMASKIRGVRLLRGRRLRLETPGGGGWGDPADRDPAAAEADRRGGYA